MASITIHDVAERAGVSIKTVSRVLNKEPNVRPATRERVLAAAESLRYRPNVSARSLAGSRSFLVALFWDNPSANYIGDLQRGAVGRCREDAPIPITATADDVRLLLTGSGGREP